MVTLTEKKSKHIRGWPARPARVSGSEPQERDLFVPQMRRRMVSVTLSCDHPESAQRRAKVGHGNTAASGRQHVRNPGDVTRSFAPRTCANERECCAAGLHWVSCGSREKKIYRVVPASSQKRSRVVPKRSAAISGRVSTAVTSASRAAQWRRAARNTSGSAGGPPPPHDGSGGHCQIKLPGTDF